MLDIRPILNIAIQGGASDVHLKAGLPPLFRIRGGLVPGRGVAPLAPADIGTLVQHMTTEAQWEALQSDRDVDFAYAVPQMGRFRCNAFYQRGRLGMVLRVIAGEVRTIADLDLPVILEKIVDAKRGLVLVTGATGSGKSTTLSAMLNHINSTRATHIVTIEDPIEYVFRDRRSVINQREIGQDATDFPRALRAAMRQDPDVIFVGEMRDQETIATALTAAETGHLVMSTLHTVDASETVDRIINIFPPHQHSQIRTSLATNLHAVLSQRLVKRSSNQGRVAAMEIMLMTGRIRELIVDPGRFHELREAIAQGQRSYGMQTFDQSLMGLLSTNMITRDEALAHCSNRDDFLLRLAGVQGTSDTQWDSFE
ncbi:MAG: twitching motility protein PilT [Bradymonadia bacterium]|jgi:twitching motility protein PilT